MDSDLRSILPEWIELLAGPILKGGYDYVAPLYSRHKHDGTITNTVTYPLTRALYGLRIRQPIGGDFGVSGDLVRHYLESPGWTPDVSKFGIDVWMTTTALTGGFAVCQARLGAKVHDPKDPGADLGPMFRQVVATILRLAVANADRWREVRGSHDIPAYGFERQADPPPLEINVLRLLSEFHAGALTMAATWREMLAPETAAEVLGLAAEADAVGRNGPRPPGARRPRRRDADDRGDGRGGRRVHVPRRPLGTDRLRPDRRRAAGTGRARRPGRRARADLLRPGGVARRREPRPVDGSGRGPRGAPGPRVRAAEAVPRGPLGRGEAAAGPRRPGRPRRGAPA